MKNNQIKLLLVFTLLIGYSNIHCQYIEKNDDYSICFPSKPTIVRAPVDNGRVLQFFDSSNEYTIQILCEAYPFDLIKELRTTDIEILGEIMYKSYLKTAGGGYLTNKENRNLNGYKATIYKIRLTSNLSLYKYANMLFLLTKNNVYTIIFYNNGNSDQLDDYLSCFKIFK